MTYVNKPQNHPRGRGKIKIIMASRTCKLCRALSDPNRSTALFTSTGIAKRLGPRISTLLQVPVDRDDGLPQYICRECNKHVAKLEEALDDLTAFRDMARCSVAALSSVRGPLKRRKETSGEVGVSPDTLRCRPRSKHTRKRLSFTCKLTTSFRTRKHMFISSSSISAQQQKCSASGTHRSSWV